MHDIALQSGWETFLLAAPFVGMVLVGVFRLDEIATNSSRGQRPRFNGPCFNGPCFNGPRFDENDESGRMLRTDPDGQPWPGSQPGFDSSGPAVTTSIN